MSDVPAGVGAGSAAAPSSDPRCTPKSVALPVLTAPGGPKIQRRWPAGKWRAAALIFVHVVILAHIAQWLLSGMDDGIRTTLSPIEPSETMYTLEGGYINAGFIFFVSAIVTTFLFGRFVCGWGCHIIAVQDFCSHIMTKVGVRPRPFRTRLLIWTPFVLAFYMFVWPTLLRVSIDGLEALLPSLGITRQSWPAWLPAISDPQGFSLHLIVEDYWRTFPPWWMSVPFILAVGVFTVYFLGSKGFCTYGCPYGGFFGPVDRFSIGRIKVDDNCNQCGHCTAVCTSNVRVHQEIRDYGMIVDAGCMKTLDCVSACPNKALSFKFMRPAIFKKKVSAAAKKGKIQRPPYDVSLGGEIGIFIIGLGFFMAYRGLFNLVPMLMAMGMALVSAFCVWKFGQMFRVPNVRVQSKQLVLRGKWTNWGRAFALLTVSMIGVAAWAGVIRVNFFQASMYDAKVDKVSLQQVYTPGYVPDAQTKRDALKAIEHFEFGGPISDGGIGWSHNTERLGRLAWLHAAAGNLAKSEHYLRLAVKNGKPSEQYVQALAETVSLQRPEEMPQAERMALVRDALQEVLDANSEADNARIVIAEIETQFAGMVQTVNPETGQIIPAAIARREEHAKKAADHALYLVNLHYPAEARVTARAIGLLVALERAPEIREQVAFDVKRRPKFAILRMAYAQVLYSTGDKELAIEQLREAIALEPMNLAYREALVGLLMELGKQAEAQAEVDALNAAQRQLEAQHAAGAMPQDSNAEGQSQGSMNER